MASIMTGKRNQDVPASEGNCVDTAAEYNTIAPAYATAAMTEKLWTHTTFYTFTNYVMKEKLDVLKDAAVLDLGCGCGVFCQWAASQGASRVVGIDFSEQQIIRAREIERCNPAFGAENTSSTIEYIMQDITAIGGAELGQFDVVVGTHILCYSQNREELRRMLNAASSCLKRGGRFVGVRECLDPASKGKVLTKVKGVIEGGPM